jgi:thymidylate synthase (FAD)
MNGTLRSYIHYLQVRTDPSTQLEHREIAMAIKDIFCKEFPIIGEAVFEQEGVTSR